MIPHAPFKRLVHEILLERSNNFRIQAEAIIALQESSEMLITQLFEDTFLLAIHGKRVTVQPKDMMLAQLLKHE